MDGGDFNGTPETVARSARDPFEGIYCIELRGILPKSIFKGMLPSSSEGMSFEAMRFEGVAKPRPRDR